MKPPRPKRASRKAKTLLKKEEGDRRVADAMTGPHLLAAVSIESVVKTFDTGHPELVPDAYAFRDSLARNAAEVNTGNLASVEATLNTQAATTNFLFGVLTTLAMANPKHSEAFERTFRLALRAQAQSARTLEILAAIKQGPRVVIAHQLNTAGQQVVNNGPAPMPAAAGIVCSAQNELSPPATPALPEPAPVPDYAPMDTRDPRQTAPAHSQLAPVDKFHRTPHRRRKANE